MTTTEIVVDDRQLNKMVEMLEGILAHRRKNPTFPSEELYYDLMARYYRRIKEAQDQGLPVVGHTVMSPLELFYGMDLVPMHLESISMMMVTLLQNHQEFFDTARGYGLAPETCSAHRLLAATMIQRYLPRPDFVVWTNQVCDNTAKSGDALMDIYEIPGIYLDRPYKYTPREVDYYSKELHRLIQFMEDQTGRKMDYDRLGQIVKNSQRVTELCREIAELRKAVPAPARCARLLGLKVGAPVLAVQRQAVDVLDRVVELRLSQNVTDDHAYFISLS